MPSIFSRIFGTRTAPGIRQSALGEAGLPPLLARLLGGGRAPVTRTSRGPTTGSRAAPTRPTSPQYRGDYSPADTSTWTFPHEAVVSSNLASVAYDFPSQTLEVRFRTSSRNTTNTCRYAGVPLGIYRGLMSASSKGKFFHALIRDRYPFTYV